MSGGGGGGGEEGPIELAFTPTWIVALVCFFMVLVSLVVERLLHFLGKYLKRTNQKPLFEALLKLKEELMLLGFFSLLLTVSQGMILGICIPESWTEYMLPCKKEHPVAEVHFAPEIARRLLTKAENEEEASGRYAGCGKNRVPLLSLEAIDRLHIFIFVLAVTHVVFTVLTIIFGGAKIRQWKPWEDSIQKEAGSVSSKITHLHEDEFIRKRYKGIDIGSRILSWLHSFVKQFYGSVTKSDYTTLRLGFIMSHCKTNPKFDFHKYMVRTLEADFKKVIGIRWYLWIFVIFFLLLNVNGWHAYFWISFIPLILLLSLGAKLEHIISQLAHEVAEKHSAIEGDVVVKPSDEHFWFQSPRLVLYLIHFILFENAFEIAYFFWILSTYGYNSCIMGKPIFIIPRLVIGVIIQILCSYSTLPLYAIVTQMGTSYKKSIFEEHVQEGLLGWAQKVKRRSRRAQELEKGPSILDRMMSKSRSSVEIQLLKLTGPKAPETEERRTSRSNSVAEGRRTSRSNSEKDSNALLPQP